MDSIGAGIGIYRAAKSLNKRAHIVVNNPTMSVRPIIDSFRQNSDYDEHMFINSEEAKELVDNNTVVVVVDTNKPSYTECEELLHKTKTIVVLDHHRQGSEVISNAVLSYIEPYASSACEMVAEILQYFSDDIRIYNIEADALYSGIMIDTNNFTAKAGVRTFEAAAFLRRCGADVTRVRKMFRDDVESYRAKAEAIRNVEAYRGCFAIMRYCMFPQESKEYCGRMASITEILDNEYIRLKMLDEELPTRDNAEGIIWKDEALVLVKASAELTLEEKIDVILEKAKKAILWELS